MKCCLHWTTSTVTTKTWWLHHMPEVDPANAKLLAIINAEAHDQFNSWKRGSDSGALCGLLVDALW